MGIENNMVEQAVPQLHPNIPRRMCQTQVYVEPSQTAHG